MLDGVDLFVARLRDGVIALPQDTDEDKPWMLRRYTLFKAYEDFMRGMPEQAPLTRNRFYHHLTGHAEERSSHNMKYFDARELLKKD